MLNPPAGWICTDFLQSNYGSLAKNTAENAQIYHQTVIEASHPFLSQIWNGSCDEGQLTAAGLEDAIVHGKVWVYLSHIWKILIMSRLLPGFCKCLWRQIEVLAADRLEYCLGTNFNRG